MREKKMDRRVKYTLNALKNAMIELLQESHISKISVVSLCQIADVNRSTFYTHFQDQYDLLQYITEEALSDIQSHLQDLNRGSDAHHSVQALNQILDYVKENADVFKALLSDNCDPDIQHKVMSMTEIISPSDYKELDERTKNYHVLFQLNGCISILHKWLDDGTPETTEEMSTLILKLIGKL
ncbi:TetR/AcrR family transcriptional regulator [Carnobacteriaceae bacterium 52-44]|jgi:Transcriptional regulator